MAKGLGFFLYRRVKQLSKKGDDLAEIERFDEALEQYGQALCLLPEPWPQWEATTWLLSAIGDAHFLKHDYPLALEALQDAVRCPNGLGNPFIHLRLGQCQFEVGNRDRAADELMRAYMWAGVDVFAQEHPKYLLFLGTVADLSPPDAQH